MLRSSFIAASSVILCATAGAQQATDFQRVPGPVKDAGIYHVATGTWTRNASGGANLGPDIVYKNDQGSGYFSTLGMAASAAAYETVDDGRVPTTFSTIAPGVVDRNVYTVSGLQFGYCSSIVGPNVNITFNFYDSYQPCDALPPANAAPNNQAGSFSVSGLPGGTTAGAACWLVTMDLDPATNGGTELRFCFEGDGGPANPGENGAQATDSFGLGHIFTNGPGTSTGPLLNGDPGWQWNTPGAIAWGGGGTYYDPNQLCGGGGDTGLDTSDLFRVQAGGSLGAGCYWFGGYKNTNGCSGAHNNPLGSFNTVLYADAGECSGSPFTQFGSPNNNSTGGPAIIAASKLLGPPSGPVLAGDLHLDVSGGPAGQSGYFLTSSVTNSGNPVSQGILYLGAPGIAIGRYNPVAGGARNSIGVFDAQGVLQNVAGTSGAGPGFDVPALLPAPPGGSIMAGQTWHYQCWYRDQNPGFVSNFSDGVSVQY